jgi:hypothetical protein
VRFFPVTEFRGVGKGVLFLPIPRESRRKIFSAKLVTAKPGESEKPHRVAD